MWVQMPKQMVHGSTSPAPTSTWELCMFQTVTRPMKFGLALAWQMRHINNCARSFSEIATWDSDVDCNCSMPSSSPSSSLGQVPGALYHLAPLRLLRTSCKSAMVTFAKPVLIVVQFGDKFMACIANPQWISVFPDSACSMSVRFGKLDLNLYKIWRSSSLMRTLLLGLHMWFRTCSGWPRYWGLTFPSHHINLMKHVTIGLLTLCSGGNWFCGRIRWAVCRKEQPLKFDIGMPESWQKYGQLGLLWTTSRRSVAPRRDFMPAKIVTGHSQHLKGLEFIATRNMGSWPRKGALWIPVCVQFVWSNFGRSPETSSISAISRVVVVQTNAMWRWWPANIKQELRFIVRYRNIYVVFEGLKLCSFMAQLCRQWMFLATQSRRRKRDCKIYRQKTTRSRGAQHNSKRCVGLWLRVPRHVFSTSLRTWTRRGSLMSFRRSGVLLWGYTARSRMSRRSTFTGVSLTSLMFMGHGRMVKQSSLLKRRTMTLSKIFPNIIWRLWYWRPRGDFGDYEVNKKRFFAHIGLQSLDPECAMVQGKPSAHSADCMRTRMDGLMGGESIDYTRLWCNAAVVDLQKDPPEAMLFDPAHVLRTKASYGPTCSVGGAHSQQALHREGPILRHSSRPRVWQPTLNGIELEEHWRAAPYRLHCRVRLGRTLWDLHWSPSLDSGRSHSWYQSLAEATQVSGAAMGVSWLASQRAAAAWLWLQLLVTDAVGDGLPTTIWGGHVVGTSGTSQSARTCFDLYNPGGYAFTLISRDQLECISAGLVGCWSLEAHGLVGFAALEDPYIDEQMALRESTYYFHSCNWPFLWRQVQCSSFERVSGTILLWNGADHFRWTYVQGPKWTVVPVSGRASCSRWAMGRSYAGNFRCGKSRRCDACRLPTTTDVSVFVSLVQIFTIRC